MTTTGLPERTADPADEVVGAMHVPAWIRRLSPVAWVVVAIAAFVGWWQLTWMLPVVPGINPGATMGAFVVAARSVATILLVAAVLIGGWTGGPRRALLVGSGMLALGVLIDTVRDWSAQPVTGLWLTSGPLGGSRGAFAALLLGTAGALILGYGVAKAAASGTGRPRLALPLAILVVGAIGTILAAGQNVASWYAMPATPDGGLPDPDPFDLAGSAVGPVALLGWATVAAAAVVGRDAGVIRPAATAGAIGVFLALVLARASFLAGAVVLVGPGETSVLLPVLDVAVAASGAGLLLLAAGLARGPGPANGDAAPGGTGVASAR